MGVPSEIKRLIERFRENREAYLSREYNETQLRREFLDPFFKALGWDVDNEQGYAEAYKDVVHEDAIKVGGATKAPDYAFRTGGTRKFFVEAKRPSVGIKDDPDAAYQLRRYAWSAKLPLSILTDFEEFAVYDTRVRPNQDDKASTARTLYFTFDEYAEKWNDIAGIFARDAILKGSFDKYVEAKKMRGTAEVDDAFLKEIEGWRDVLARNIALRNTGLSNREVNFAVQRTIDRIIFLRICEDRGIETDGQLMALRNGTEVYPRLCEVFRRADDRYNSGLFHFRGEKGRQEAPDELTLGLQIDDKVLKDVFKDLYYPDSPYEFSVLPADILGHIYEQFLGKVIRLTAGHRAVVEEKPEVRKAGGVYYTPTYIVDYIVEHTVGKLLEDKTPNHVAKLRVLDPACGSGSFLLGAYQRLLNWHLTWYTENDPAKHAKGRQPKIFQGPGGDWRLTTAEKKRVLVNSIHGVDIDPQAVEVTKLSLLLKVLEGESEETLGKNLRLFHERALPDLGENIKCGNSLIGPDFYEGKQLSLIDEDERYRINAFDWNTEFPEIMKAGGFDAVIGNPPYIQLSMAEYYEPAIADYLRAAYSSSMGRLNTYGFFWERSTSYLARKGGRVGYIVPNTILTQSYYEGLRETLLKNRIREVAVHKYHVFKGAVVEPVVLVVERTPSSGRVRIAIHNAQGGTPTVRKLHQDLFRDAYKRAFLVEATEDELRLKSKVDDEYPRFSDLLSINQAIALKGDRSRSLHKQRMGSNYYPVLDGREIGRFSIHWDGNYLEYVRERIHSCKRTDIFEQPEKILFRRVGEGIVATLDRNQFYALNTLVVITPAHLGEHDLTYVLAVLNSTLMNWYYSQFLKSSKRTFSEVQAQQIAQLPFRTVDFDSAQDRELHDNLAGRAEDMMRLREAAAPVRTDHEQSSIQRQIDATDKQIDQLVYELYGLTDEEIRIVEEATE